jgi:RNA polymerase sigma factor (sigma-70 family)
MVQPYSESISPGVVVTEAPTDGEDLLKQRLVQGDSAAFWEVWERYREGLFYPRCLRWMGGDWADTEDALSNACVKAWQRLPGCIHEIISLKSWLTQLLHNLCIDMRRERDRHRRATQLLPSTPLVEGQARAYESPEAMILRQELALRIRWALEDLPPNLRQPSILRFYHAMPYRDIATQLHLSPVNVRKRIQQARAILRVQLQDYLLEDGAGRL